MQLGEDGDRRPQREVEDPGAETDERLRQDDLAGLVPPRAFRDEGGASDQAEHDPFRRSDPAAREGEVQEERDAEEHQEHPGDLQPATGEETFEGRGRPGDGRRGHERLRRPRARGGGYQRRCDRRRCDRRAG